MDHIDAPARGQGRSPGVPSSPPEGSRHLLLSPELALAAGCRRPQVDITDDEATGSAGGPVDGGDPDGGATDGGDSALLPMVGEARVEPDPDNPSGATVLVQLGHAAPVAVRYGRSPLTPPTPERDPRAAEAAPIPGPGLDAATPQRLGNLDGLYHPHGAVFLAAGDDRLRLPMFDTGGPSHDGRPYRHDIGRSRLVQAEVDEDGHRADLDGAHGSDDTGDPSWFFGSTRGCFGGGDPEGEARWRVNGARREWCTDRAAWFSSTTPSISTRGPGSAGDAPACPTSPGARDGVSSPPPRGRP